MPGSRTHRLIVLGADRVGKTAIIEHLIFGNHVIGHVRASSLELVDYVEEY